MFSHTENLIKYIDFHKKKCYNYAVEVCKKEKPRMAISKWDKRFMDLTETVATWSSCFQENRHVGAIIVKDKRVMTTGYNGAPAGVKSCEEKG